MEIERPRFHPPYDFRSGRDPICPCYLPRDLHKLFRAAGLTLADVRTFSIVENRYDPSSYAASVIGITRDLALKHGVPAGDVAAWEEDLRPRTAEGEWFFCLSRFVFTGTK
jgi:hypothetical protein